METEIGIVYDVCGRKINIGDYILYSTMRGSSPALKFGFVLGFKTPIDAMENARIEVIGVHTNWRNPSANRNIALLRFPSRTVVIHRTDVPERVLALMDSF